MKVVTSKDYLFKRTFHMDVITRGGLRGTCSPAVGFNALVYSEDKMFPCVTLKENFQGEGQICRFKCDGRYGLDFVLVEIKRLNDDMMQVCEIDMG